MYEIVAILAFVAFLYSAIGAGIERTPFGGAIIFTAVGFEPETLKSKKVSDKMTRFARYLVDLGIRQRPERVMSRR